MSEMMLYIVQKLKKRDNNLIPLMDPFESDKVSLPLKALTKPDNF